MTQVPTLPESAPFTSQQRAWLNGFFAAILSGNAAGTNGTSGAMTGTVASTAAVVAPPPPEETFPWHDPALPLEERQQLAEGRPVARRLMASMAQLNCGACGYLCQTYAEAIAEGKEKDLTRCTPGGTPTAKALKLIVATAKEEPQPVAVSSNAVDDAAKNGSSPATTYSRSRPFSARLASSTRLTHDEAPKDTRHVVIELLDSGLTYEPGDSLGILPQNDADLVQAVIRILGKSGGETVVNEAGGKTSLRALLTQEMQLTRVRPELLSLLMEHATDEVEQRALREQAELEDSPLLGGDVAELLERFPSARPPLPDLLAALGKLQPRLYSISSSLKAHPGQVHLTVGVVRYESLGRWRSGVASHFLGVRSLPGEEIRVFIQPSKFRLPQNPNAPVIMIGPGTGIAPFRAFLEERRAVGAKGKSWLFFGNQFFEYDFLYKDELSKYQDEGVLTRLDLAFSRDQAEKLYVQHRILENGRELWHWLEEGANLYICGDAKRMAIDVEHALRTVIEQYGGHTEQGAKEYLAQLRKEHRYHKDVY